MEKNAVLSEVGKHLLRDEREKAKSILDRHYPFAPLPVTERRYTLLDSTRVFLRDGFVDRYTGERLVFPPVLRLISNSIPTAFPYHPNWKTDVTHPAYWELSATIDHLVPVSRGGPDDESNWVTTSMARNKAKLNWTLDQLGWNLHSPGTLDEWDGMFGWFVEFGGAKPNRLASTNLKSWYRAAVAAT